MITPTAFVANVLQGCVICWSPTLEAWHWFPPTDLYLREPPAIVAPEPKRAPTPHKARPVPKPSRPTITIPGYTPPLRHIPQWLNPQKGL